MISKCDDCEYTILIAELMVTLSKLDKFTLMIWVNTSELPFIYSDEHDIKFLQEGIMIVTSSMIDFLFYDIITNVRIKYD